MDKSLDVQVWSDIACPWCYVGKRRLEAALERFAHKDQVSVTWRAFELDPGAPRVRPNDGHYAQRLADKYGMSLQTAEQRLRQMTATAAADGLDFRFDKVRAGNTFDAHRLVHLGHTRGLGDTVKERILRAYMSEGEAVGEPETLVRLGVEAGLPEADVRALLTSDLHAADVRADEREAAELGIRGVPFFVIGGRYGVSGAQPADALLEVLEQAWSEQIAEAGAGAEAEYPEGAACGPEGC